MKKGIHPQYYPKATAVCGCGAVFTVGSTQEKMEIDSCSQCHPLYTGEKRNVEAKGRVRRFEELTKRMQKVQEEQKNKAKREEKNTVRTKKQEEKQRAQEEKLAKIAASAKNN